MTLYLVTACGQTIRQSCKTVAMLGPSGIVWHHCTCRPGVRVADPARVLHAGQRAGDRLTERKGTT